MLKISLLAWLVVFIEMCVIWGYYRYTKNPGVVDVGWSLGFFLAGTIFLFHSTSNLRLILIYAVLCIWALRLAGYLYFTRVRKGHIEKRYTELSDSWKMSKSLGFFLNFQFQGVLILIISSSLYFAGSNQSPTPNVLDIFGMLLCCLGIIGESIADLQLYNFVQQHKGQVCDHGLWKFSRHPNYFFEWLVWCGFAILAFSTEYGLIAIISPLTLYLIMNKLTIPITEDSSLKSKGDLYRNYKNKTSKFFIWKSK